MKDQWYGDNRDLAKWGTLLEIARKFGCKHILQVLYYRPSSWGEIEIDGDRVALSPDVRKHFRSCESITGFGGSISIETLTTEFHSRKSYLERILSVVSWRENTPGIVFLDPDTGLEPKGSAGLQHVLESELLTVWKSLSTGDILVFYQHKTRRNNKPWIPDKLKQFETALGLTTGHAKLAFAPKIANDVAFFFAQRT